MARGKHVQSTTTIKSIPTEANSPRVQQALCASLKHIEPVLKHKMTEREPKTNNKVSTRINLTNKAKYDRVCSPRSKKKSNTAQLPDHTPRNINIESGSKEVGGDPPMPRRKDPLDTMTIEEQKIFLPYINKRQGQQVPE